MKEKNKRGISGVVVAVLLVLITFVAIAMVWAFILPMVRENLEEGESCFDLRDNAEIVESETYTCYDSSKTNLMIRREFEDIAIGGFVVSITSGGSSNVYELVNGKESEPSGVIMLSGGININMPEPGGAETYVFPVSGNRAELGVVSSSGKICNMGSFKIPQCLS